TQTTSPLTFRAYARPLAKTGAVKALPSMMCAEPSCLNASGEASARTRSPVSVRINNFPPTEIKPLKASFGSDHLIWPVFQSRQRRAVGEAPAPSELLPLGP